MYLYSLNTFEIVTYDSGFTGKVITWDRMFIFLMIYKTFLLFWMLLFLHDASVFITMASVTSYYFSSTKEIKGTASVEKAIKMSFLKHFGSIALGSLIHKFILFLKTII